MRHQRRCSSSDCHDAAGIHRSVCTGFLNDRNSWLQWASIGVGFLGLVIFVGAERTTTGTALWVYLLLCSLWFEDFAAKWNGDLVFSVVWLGIVVSVLAYGLMFQLIHTREATRVTALQYFVPPVTMILASVALAEALTLTGMACLDVTMSQFWLMQRGAARL